MAYQKISIKDADGNLIVGAPTFDGNNQAVVTIAYESDEANLSGVGVGFNFDATGLSVVSVDNVFAGAIASGEQSGDGDAQSLSFGWASLFGGWPGSTNSELATITFDILEGATGTTVLNIEKVVTATSNDAAIPKAFLYLLSFFSVSEIFADTLSGKSFAGGI